MVLQIVVVKLHLLLEHLMICIRYYKKLNLYCITLSKNFFKLKIYDFEYGLKVQMKFEEFFETKKLFKRIIPFFNNNKLNKKNKRKAQQIFFNNIMKKKKSKKAKSIANTKIKYKQKRIFVKAIQNFVYFKKLFKYNVNKMSKYRRKDKKMIKQLLPTILKKKKKRKLIKLMQLKALKKRKKLIKLRFFRKKLLKKLKKSNLKLYSKIKKKAIKKKIKKTLKLKKMKLIKAKIKNKKALIIKRKNQAKFNIRKFATSRNCRNKFTQIQKMRIKHSNYLAFLEREKKRNKKKELKLSIRQKKAYFLNTNFMPQILLPTGIINFIKPNPLNKKVKKRHLLFEYKLPRTYMDLLKEKLIKNYLHFFL